MRFYTIKTPKIIKLLFPRLLWKVKTEEKVVYLTFDDGPTPNVTTFVLKQLKKYNAKATFFCIGKNAKEHPEILKEILAQGHTIGNHTYNHFNCAKQGVDDYLKNVEKADKTFQRLIPHLNTKLFRPPYGRISLRASRELRNKNYKIIMWDVLSADFDTNISAEKCIENVVTNVKAGSIVVFHDSVKSFPILQKALPVILKDLNRQNFILKSI
ncbi:polysaccharide deacetylase family protein [Galbibacter sp. BG1]|uniref:polysaccharide deacetylase family protein n=1 Tax=Galbibacter sp. BG1 TaxID=1170699 RepID=UPI0015C06919|nr:polysaccharide deacetylase family protein [Galbibacter sp. BG1]QLE00857.1 polysaccharide deacetylase family protein [Galbibacter sp. BG1]